MKSDATISHFSNWLGHECFKTFLTFKTEQSGNIQDTVGKTVFKASCCVLPEIPVRAEKPLHKTKENNKEAQPRFNRAEMISLLTADITSRENHPLLEGRGLLVASLDQSCTSRTLHASCFTQGSGRRLQHTLNYQRYFT